MIERKSSLPGNYHIELKSRSSQRRERHRGELLRNRSQRDERAQMMKERQQQQQRAQKEEYEEEKNSREMR